METLLPAALLQAILVIIGFLLLGFYSGQKLMKEQCSIL